MATSKGHRFHCHSRQCGKTFHWRRGAGLHCSKACETAEAAARGADAVSLAKAGFTHEGNGFTKDGVVISQEMVARLGIEKAIKQHAKSVAALARAAAGQPPA